MRIHAKLLLTAMVLALLGASSLFGLGPQLRSTQAAPVSLAVSGDNTATLTVLFRVNDDVGAPGLDSSVTLSVTTGSGLGSFQSGGIIPADGAGGAACNPTFAVTIITYTDACIDAIDGDALEEIQPPATNVSVVFQCIGNGTVVFTLSQSVGTTGGATPQTFTATCNIGGTGGGTGGGLPASNVGLVNVTASPNALVCGGTSTITAQLRNMTTGDIIPVAFHFTTGTLGSETVHQGQLIQQSDNTAILALLPGHVSTTVTASTILIVPGGKTATIGGVTVPVPEIVSGTIVVQNYCGEQVTAPLAVVAAPNVIACGGTAKITATARDLSGIIIPGTGFTFTTDYGVLVVGPPNTAASTSGTATLTLQPGMGAEDPSGTSPGVRFATVTARLGDKEGTVKVQQFCPGVTTDSSTAPGRIVLNPSQTAISCSGNSFIGAVVKDSKGQVPPDDTEVTFIATSGQFTAASSSGTGSSTQTTTRPSATVTPTSGSGTSTSSTTTTSGQFIAKTSKNGALNVIYNAGPDSNGLVSITAAAGAAFGTTTITVNCPTAIAAGSASAFGAGGAFRPPSTGEGLIKPPNTGDAGLVVE